MKRSIQDIRARRDAIIQLLNDAPDQTLSVETLASLMHVSNMTIRRDLTLLDKMGVIQRHHGAATLIEKPNFEGDTKNTHLEQIKYAIAKKAASYIQQRMTVYMNTSSTALQTVDFLKNIPITVVTNNLHMSHKEMHPASTIILSGGEIHFPKAALVGELAAESLNHINANICIMGCSGISPTAGITTGDFRESKINQLMIQKCRSLVIVVADYRKIGTVSNFLVASLDEIDILITDIYCDPAIIKEIEAQGVAVIQIDDSF